MNSALPFFDLGPYCVSAVTCISRPSLYDSEQAARTTGTVLDRAAASRDRWARGAFAHLFWSSMPSLGELCGRVPARCREDFNRWDFAYLAEAL
eukprot:3507858-Prymnesium_polylepis.1